MSARVLVVDDEKLIRWGLCQSLKDAGYGTEQAGTVSEALDAVGREMPDLLLLDYKLPDGSGIDVLRSVRKSSPRTPVVMITAHASVGGAVEAMKEGAYDYLAICARSSPVRARTPARKPRSRTSSPRAPACGRSCA
jgi:DNA-binding NtrC family response regulator